MKLDDAELEVVMNHLVQGGVCVVRDFFPPEAIKACRSTAAFRGMPCSITFSGDESWHESEEDGSRSSRDAAASWDGRASG